MNRVVYDGVDQAPSKLDGGDQQEETKGGQAQGADGEIDDGPQKQAVAHSNDHNDGGLGATSESPSDCDNDTILTPYYQPSFKNDHTLVFESRFESGNLRRAI